MPASMETQKFVKEELPYLVLRELYKDSRLSFQELGRKMKISYHTVATVLKHIESEYGLVYTLDLNSKALGFSESRLLTVKFEKQPPLEFLKERLSKDPAIQDAYLTSGDFDLVLYIVEVNPSDVQSWLWKFRVDLSEYKPAVKVGTQGPTAIGFMPLRSDTIRYSSILSGTEKRVLAYLNDNSRARLGDVCKACKIDKPMHAVYIIKKLKAKGMIRRFSTLVQNPDKKVLSVFTISLLPSKEHHKLFLKFIKELVKEDLHEVTSDYCFWNDTSGVFDALCICTFKDGEHLLTRGPAGIRDLWASEGTRTESAIITSCMVGRLPFHLEDYPGFRMHIEPERDISAST